MSSVMVEAATDNLSDKDYRDIFEDLREGRTLRGFATMMQSLVPDGVSHAAWDKYEKNPETLTVRMKAELRKAMGLPVLPLLIGDAVAAVVPPTHVLVMTPAAGRELDQVVIGNSEDERWQFLSNGPAPAPAPAAPKRVRAKRARPSATMEQDARREKLGLKWEAVIEAGLAALESAHPPEASDPAP